MSMRDPSEAILTELKAGQEQALRQVMDAYSRPLIFFADTMVSDKVVAEEIVQDTFVKLWDRRDSFEKAKSIRAFLYIATRNACLNYLKSAKRRYTADVDELSDTLASTDRDLLTRIIHAELITELYREVECLPEQYGRIFRMTYLEDKTTEEICAELSITPNAVFTGRSKATRLLRNVFKGKDLLLYLAFVQLVGATEGLWN